MPTPTLKEVFCMLQIEGTHSWPTCPFDEVAYLRNPHRHVFHIKAYKRVYHDDRDTEFIIMKRQIHQWFLNHYANRDNENPFLCEFGAKSCEMIAQELIDFFELTRCEVSEDGENGAVLLAER